MVLTKLLTRRYISNLQAHSSTKYSWLSCSWQANNYQMLCLRTSFRNEAKTDVHVRLVSGRGMISQLRCCLILPLYLSFILLTLGTSERWGDGRGFLVKATPLTLVPIASEALKGVLGIRWHIECHKTKDGPVAWLATLVRAASEICMSV